MTMENTSASNSYMLRKQQDDTLICLDPDEDLDDKVFTNFLSV